MNVTSVTSVTNDKGNNEMILGSMHISPGIFLRAEDPGKPQLRKQTNSRNNPI